MDTFWKNSSQNFESEGFYLKTDPLKIIPGEIPEIYHFTWFNCRNFTVINFLCIYSVLKFSSPNSKIYFHTDCPPDRHPDTHFGQILKLAGPRIILQKIQPLTQIFPNLKIKNEKVNGKFFQNLKINQTPNHPTEISHIEHVSDVYRILVLYQYGGVYVDDDVIFLKNHAEFFQKIRKKLVISIESHLSLANGLMMAPARLEILLKWLLEWKFLDKKSWGAFSVIKIANLAKIYPEKFHLISDIMVRPNRREKDLLYSNYFDFSQHYNMHLCNRNIESFYLEKLRDLKNDQKRRIFKNLVQLKTLPDIDCLPYSFGEVLRWVAYGKADFCGK